MAAVASQRSNVGSAIVAPQPRGDSLPLRPQVGELKSKMDYHKCSALREGCFFSPLFPGFLIFVRSNEKHTSPVLHYQEVTDLNLDLWFVEDVPGSSVLTCVVGATFTFVILSLAPMSSLAKTSRNVSVVDAGCFVIQLRVEINSPNANAMCLLLFVTACSSFHEMTSCADVEEIADITKAKLMDEVMLSFVVSVIAFAGNPSRITSKGQLAKDKSELVATMCETTSSMSFYNIFRVECIERFRRSQKNMLRVNSVREVGADAKMSVIVSRVKPLLDNSVVAESGNSKSSCRSTKAVIPLLRALKTCWLWVFLLMVLLSSSRAYSDEDTQRSEEGKCRYDLTSIAALSCMQPHGVWRPPSQTCCNALLYAIDHIPGSDEGGACCLCRYLKEKKVLSELATTYVLCNGKDKGIISKWSTFLIKDCSAECATDTSVVDMGTSANEYSPVLHSHVPSKGVWITVAVFSVIALVCFWHYWRSKAVVKSSEQQRISSHEGEHRAGHRRSVIPSSSPSKKVKERRFSSS